MPATLEYLFNNVRSQLAEEVLAYLDDLAVRMAELPKYYPEHLRANEAGTTRFDDIRQMVQVVEDRSIYEQWRAEERERARAAGMDYDPTRARPEFDNPDAMLREFESFIPPLPPIPWDEHAGERFKRAVILGDPGFGKTWLLRYEARRLARKAARKLRENTIRLDDLIFPIFQRLSDVSHSDDPLEETLVALVGTGHSEAFRCFVREKLETEQGVILLDAWDEVPVEIPKDGQPLRYEAGFRQHLGQRLEAFARQFPDPRLLLTSRIIGYTESPIPDAQELELLAFDTPQIESFVQVWFGDNPEIANQFQAMLRQNHQVRGLARIPLMLSLMCLAYQKKSLTFPTHRVELYDRCLRGLLREWKEEKKYHISNAYVEAMLELLQAIGYRLFVGGYEQFNESDLRRTIGDWLDSLKRSHEFYHRNPSSLITELKRDGILITAGEQRDAPLLFLHRTFHEYLTAAYLAQLVNDKKRDGWETQIEVGDTTCTVRTLVDKKAWDPRWQEVIILLAGRLTNPVPLLEMLSHPDPTPTNPHGDDLFRHRLALAALCLPELMPEIRNSHSEIIDCITTDAFSFWWQHKKDGISNVVQHQTRTLPGLGQVNGRMCKTSDEDNDMPLLKWLTQRFRDKGMGRHVSIALEHMGAVVAEHPEVLSALVAALHDEEWSVRFRAAVALGCIGATATQHPEVLSALVAALQDTYWLVRSSVAVALLGPMEPITHHSEVLSALRIVDVSEMRHIERSAIFSEMRHVEMKQIMLTDLVNLIDRTIIMKKKLRATVTQHPEVLPTLVAALHDEAPEVRSVAAAVLGRIGVTVTQHPEVLPTLVAALHDEAPEVCSTVAAVLGQMGTVAAEHPKVLPSLVAALHDEEEDVRSNAAKALGRMEVPTQHPEVLSALVAALHDKVGLVRSSAVMALGWMGAPATQHSEVLPALVAALHDEEGAVRSNAAGALGRIGAVVTQHSEVLPALVAALHDEEGAVRSNAAKALGRMEVPTQHPEVLSALVAALHDKVGLVRSSAVMALGRMGVPVTQHPEVLSALVAALHDKEWAVRSNAAKALGHMGASATRHPEVFSALVAALYDEEWSIDIGISELIAWGVRIFRRHDEEYKGRTVAELSALD